MWLAVIGWVGAVELPPGGTFVDDDGSVHEGDIEAIVAAGITFGCNPPFADRFCPDDPVTRGQMAAFLVRSLGLSAPGPSGFVDTAGTRFERDIDAVAAAGITRGCNPPANDRYCPDAQVTRGQMAAFLVRAFAYQTAEAGTFLDVSGSTFATDIDALAAAGITRGCNPPADDRYCPENLVTRAQMASFLTRALGLTPMIPPPRLDLAPPSCATGGVDVPSGNPVVVAGGGPVSGSGAVQRYTVEVEAGLAVDPLCFAEAVESVLSDPRSWGAAGTVSFQRVDQGSVAFRVTLASPATTDSLCLPLDTGGVFSCWNGSRAVINSWRWALGADAYGDEVEAYRVYLVNHEVGHALGNDHRTCPAGGSPAPVMMQQTKGVAPCLPNSWPLPDELG